MINGTPGKRYSVETNGAALGANNWTATATVTNNAVQAPFQHGPGAPSRFYRLRLLP
jgi:hypothetical protein